MGRGSLNVDEVGLSVSLFFVCLAQDALNSCTCVPTVGVKGSRKFKAALHVCIESCLCFFLCVKSGRYRHSHRGRQRQFSHRLGGVPRKRKLIDTPMDERPQCKFFKEGKCNKVGMI